MSERRRGRTVHTRSTLSATRRKARAVQTEAEKAAKEVPPEPKVVVAKPAPTERPYRKPPSKGVKKQARTVSNPGTRLLQLIDKEGGRDIIIEMSNPEQTPQGLAEELMMNGGVVIKALNRHGNGKDQVKRLIDAIAQAPEYLKNNAERPVTTGIKKQKRQDEAREKQQKIAAEKKNPRTRKVVVPTVADLVPTRSDDKQIVLEELKRYLGNNDALRQRIISARRDRVGRILRNDVGPQFDARVKALLLPTSEYHLLLEEAGIKIRHAARQHVTPETPPEPVASTQNGLSPSQREVFARFDQATAAAAQAAADDPEALARQAIFDRQEASLRSFWADKESAEARS